MILNRKKPVMIPQFLFGISEQKVLEEIEALKKHSKIKDLKITASEITFNVKDPIYIYKKKTERKYRTLLGRFKITITAPNQSCYWQGTVVSDNKCGTLAHPHIMQSHASGCLGNWLNLFTKEAKKGNVVNWVELFLLMLEEEGENYATPWFNLQNIEHKGLDGSWKTIEVGSLAHRELLTRWHYKISAGVLQQYRINRLRTRFGR